MSKNNENLQLEENLNEKQDDLELIISYKELDEKFDKIISKIKTRKIKVKRS